MATIATERPLFLVADHQRRAIAASDAYCDLIGRDRSGIVGHSWEEWVTREEFETSNARCARAVAGPPQKFVRQLERADQTAITIAGTTTQLTLGGTPCLLASIHILFAPLDLQAGLYDHQAEVALYIEAMAGGLASIVASAGLVALRDSLNTVAGQAAQMAADLSRRHRLQHRS